MASPDHGRHEIGTCAELFSLTPRERLLKINCIGPVSIHLTGVELSTTIDLENVLRSIR